MASDTQTPKIFISYRHEDAPFAAHTIYETLANHYGADLVLFDVKTIPVGVDYLDYLKDKVNRCKTLLAIIGHRWVDARSENGKRRLDDPKDLVRVEILAALKRGIPVVPVLIGGVAMPEAQHLPKCLKRLVDRHAVEIRPGRHIQAHLDSLVRDLDRVLEYTAEKEVEPLSASPSQLTEPVTDAPSKSAEQTSNYMASIDDGWAISKPTTETAPVEPLTGSISMHLALIPAGELSMGPLGSDPQAGKLEKPRHTVRIDEPFRLGVYPVTQEEYEQVIGENPAKFRGNPRLPVERVSWFDAIEFCNCLSDLDGLDRYYGKAGGEITILGGSGYRLPTEIEWEYACRAGTTQWSDDDDKHILDRSAWLEANSERKTHPVGEKKPNTWGLFDVHGNVWEWCWDGYEGQPTEQSTDPSGSSQATLRVIRGGSWWVTGYCRAAFRYGDVPLFRSDYLGFRVAAGPPSKSSQ